MVGGAPLNAVESRVIRTYTVTARTLNPHHTAIPSSPSRIHKSCCDGATGSQAATRCGLSILP